MPLQILSLRMVNKTDDLETHIDSLLRQKEVLEKIEEYTDNKLDFGDLLETYNLLVEEIRRRQKELREERQKCLPDISGERGKEGEGISSSSIFETEDLEKFNGLVSGR